MLEIAPAYLQASLAIYAVVNIVLSLYTLPKADGAGSALFFLALSNVGGVSAFYLSLTLLPQLITLGGA